MSLFKDIFSTVHMGFFSKWRRNLKDNNDLKEKVKQYFIDVRFRDKYPIKYWNTSSVTSMEYLFSGKDFNEDIGNWDTSNVTDMSFMFFNTPFNCDISKWNTSKVVNMEGMFAKCSSFNQPLNTTIQENQNKYWDVSNVTNMAYMFREATNFNQPLNNWNVSNVRNMTGMFNLAIHFNQPINNWIFNPRVNYDVMFSGATAFINNKNNYMFVLSDDLRILNYEERVKTMIPYLLQKSLQNETPLTIHDAVGSVYKSLDGGKTRAKHKHINKNKKSRRRKSTI